MEPRPEPEPGRPSGVPVTLPRTGPAGQHRAPRRRGTVAPSSTRYRLALPGGDDRGVAGPTARPALTAPPIRPVERLGGDAPAGGGSEVAFPGLGGPEPAPRPTLRDLVQREHWVPSAAGAPRARPPADIAYRLVAWYQVPGITAGQAAEMLLLRSAPSDAG